MAYKMKHKKDLTGKVAAAVEALDGMRVNVGVISGEHQWLASIHEYGCVIPVTPAMRGYLHSIGVHLKKSTTQIVIPERSFLRAGYDKYRNEVLDTCDDVLPDVLAGRMTTNQYCKLVGTLLRDNIKEYTVDLSEPPKKPWPTRDPAKSNPLIITGDLVNGIEYEIERG